MSGSFTILPREIRDAIWRFAVVPTDAQVRFYFDSQKGRVKLIEYIGLGLLFTDRRTSLEVWEVFYGENTLCFPEDEFGEMMQPLDDILPTVSRFFRTVSSQTLAMIRMVRLKVDWRLKEWLNDPRQSQFISKSIGDWASICDTIAYKCTHLRSLHIAIDMGCGDPRYRRLRTYPHVLPEEEEAKLNADLLPAWAYFFGKLRGLQHLRVDFRCEMIHDDFTVIRQHVLFHIMEMRAQMLRYTPSLPREPWTVCNQGIRSRMTNSNYDDWVGLEITLDLDDCGHSAFKPEKRAKLRTNVWCKYCGRFDTWGYCTCSLGNSVSALLLGTLKPNEASTWRESTSAGDVWHSERWGGGPISQYLPDGATMEDYEQAQKYEQEGYDTHKNSISSLLGQEEAIVEEILEAAVNYDYDV